MAEDKYPILVGTYQHEGGTYQMSGGTYQLAGGTYQLAVVRDQGSGIGRRLPRGQYFKFNT